MLVTNNIGNYNIYKYENFYNSNNATFSIKMALNIGCSGKVIPTAYKKIANNDDESIPVGKYPTFSWSSDAYINWLTQNAVNLTTTLAIKTGELVAGEPTSIGGLIGSFYTASLLPNIEGGQNTADVNYADKRNTIKFYQMRVKNENLKIIDNYFTKYGYRISEIKSPNLTGRTYWNYVKIGETDDIGYGTVPAKFMEDINNACRKGVTIWHNHANIGNYSLNNTIV